jgi:hypothetical protein
LTQFVILFESTPAGLNDGPWSLRRFLAEHFHEDNGVGVDSIDESPRDILVLDPELMTPRSDHGHRSRMGQAELLSFLQTSQQEPGLEPGSPGEGRRFYLAFQPDERPVIRRDC